MKNISINFVNDFFTEKGKEITLMMAENAANVTKTYQIRPSILEVLAQQSLNETLYPVFQRVFYVCGITNIIKYVIYFLVSR